MAYFWHIDFFFLGLAARQACTMVGETLDCNVHKRTIRYSVKDSVFKVKFFVKHHLPWIFYMCLSKTLSSFDVLYSPPLFGLEPGLIDTKNQLLTHWTSAEHFSACWMKSCALKCELFFSKSIIQTFQCTMPVATWPTHKKTLTNISMQLGKNGMLLKCQGFFCLFFCAHLSGVLGRICSSFHYCASVKHPLYLLSGQCAQQILSSRQFCCIIRGFLNSTELL